MRTTSVLLLALCLVFQTGCDFNKKERSAAESQLELARSKGDLDGMFTVLKTLQNLGDKSQARSDELAKVREAIAKLQTIRLNMKEGKNAQAFKNADAFLRPFPNHEEVRGIIATIEKSKADRIARLESAKARLDFDSMQSVLRDLESTEELSDELKAELEKDNSCVAVSQKMRAAQGAHDHEATVNIAGEIIALYPEYPEAIKAFKESGLIFRYAPHGLRG
jgi:outer membrane protein assembly factor BamD (BamD/ComL family)